MYRLGLLGNGISYSLSPLIHNYWLKFYAIEGTYTLFDTPLTEFNAQWERFLNSSIHGFNITIPYKAATYQMLPLASTRLQAINTVYKNGDTYASANTDVEGGLDLFKDYSGTDRVVILGNGGTARALVEIFHLLKAKEIHIVQRQVKEWHPDYNLNFYDLGEAEHLSAEATILINTIPSFTFPLENLTKETLVCDYVYPESLLLNQAFEKGCNTISGVEFLLRQAQHSFKYWFNVFPDITPELRQRLGCV